MANVLEACKLSELHVSDNILGTGFFATVFEVTFKGLKCAGKKVHLIKDEDLQNALSRFDKECRLLSKVRHPNIVQFLGVYFQENSEIPLLVMEYLPMTLTSCIGEYGLLPKDISYSILHDIALGLCYLHNHPEKIIHRDLSSNNVLLSHNFTAKISDLGVAKILNLTPFQRATNPTFQGGTPDFMPPEAAILQSKDKYSPSMDAFSYGMLMIHVLSAQWPTPKIPPITYDDEGQMVPNSEATRRANLLEAIGHEHPLMGLILRCIENIPRNRAQAHEMVQELQGPLASEITPLEESRSRLDVLLEIEKYEEVIENERGEEMEVVKNIERMEHELREMDDQLKEVNITQAQTVEELKLEQQIHLHRHKKLSETKKRLEDKLKLHKELLNSTLCSLQQIQEIITGETAQDTSLASGEDSQVKFRMKRSKTASDVPSTNDPVYTMMDVQKRRSIEFSTSQKEASGELLKVMDHVPHAGNSPWTATLRKKIGKKFKQIMSRQQSHPSATLHVAKVDYDAKGEDELSFKKGDLFHVLTDDGNWCRAKHLDSGQEGNVPSAIVMEQKSLDTERWFFGKLEHERVNELLMRNENMQSSYLVCESVTNPGTYTFYIRNNDSILMYPIKQTKDGKFYMIKKHVFNSIQDMVNYHCQNVLQPCLVPTDHNEIDLKQVKLLKKLSQGRFSEVWHGLLKGREVTVKILSNEIPPQSKLHEARILQNLVHGNIISLLGVCSQENPPYIITEYMVGGNLLEYLKGGNRELLKEQDLIKMAAEVASGMLKLELSECIHRDLAARNVFVGENCICKIGNFHFAQAERIGHTFQIQPDVKWSAPEVLTPSPQFSIKSDAWSFGIVVYEIITLGHAPYPHMTDDEVRTKVVQEDYVMQKPRACPDNLYTLIMRGCWNKDPARRPTFEALQWMLDDFYTLRDDYLYGYDYEP